MSALPAAVQRQIDRANELAKQVSSAPPANDPAPTPAADTAPAPAPDEQPAGSPPPAVAEWEQKYRVLQGKYNAEVPRLQNQLRDQSVQLRTMQDQLTATQQLLATLGTQRGAGPATSAAPQASTKLVKDEEIREYGSDLYDFIQRAARESVLPEVDTRLEEKLKPVSQKISQVEGATANAAQQISKSAEQDVLSFLAEAVPNWQKLNEDEQFLDWLDLPDPYSGFKRGDLLQQAYKRHDGPRVVAFFKGYLNENAAVTPRSGSADSAAPAPQKRLDDLVAPGTSKTGTTGAQEEAGKRIWTRAQITKFYSDVSAGRYRNDAKGRKSIEQDIFKAQAEGRIR